MRTPGLLLRALTPPATSTGLQVGCSIDEGETRWLPTAPPGVTTKASVEIPEGAHEDREERWNFHHQMNVAAAPQPCYTGASAGAWKVHVEAVAD